MSWSDLNRILARVIIIKIDMVTSMCYSSRVSNRVKKRVYNTVYNVTDTVGHVLYWVPIIAMVYTVVLINATNVTSATRKAQ